jgi:hypothetical protein
LEKEFEGAGVAEGKGAAKLSGDEEVLGEIAEFSEGYFVVDFVSEQASRGAGSGLAGASVGTHAMAVVPVGKGAAKLVVAEVIVPNELGDLGFPGDAYGSVGKGFEGEAHARAGTGGDAFALCGWVGWWRGSVGGFFNAGVLPARHKARKIFRVGEEGKDELDGVGEPLFGVVVITHNVDLVPLPNDFFTR